MEYPAAQVFSLASSSTCARIIGVGNVTEIVMDPIPALVIRYRNLKAKKDGLDREMTEVKLDLVPAVEAIGGKWTDDQGYAKMVERSDSVGYPSAPVERLAMTWSESEDPIMRSCGEMLLGLRREKAGFSYLQVK